MELLWVICQERNLTKFFLVAMRLGVTPVLIPNTMVKTKTADGTLLETVWESRWLPEKILHLSCRSGDRSGNIMRAYSSAG